MAVGVDVTVEVTVEVTVMVAVVRTADGPVAVVWPTVAPVVPVEIGGKPPEPDGVESHILKWEEKVKRKGQMGY